MIVLIKHEIDDTGSSILDTLFRYGVALCVLDYCIQIDPKDDAQFEQVIQKFESIDASTLISVPLKLMGKVGETIRQIIEANGYTGTKMVNVNRCESDHEQ